MHIMLMGVKCPHYHNVYLCYLEFQDINGHISHVFDDQLFNGVIDNVTGSRVILEIDMVAAQSRSNTSSAHRTARNMQIDIR